MTLRHMKIYVAVFHYSNITKAAEELHLAQPSVSLAIKELEEYYGIRLFERMGRRILPTEGGKEFYGYALHIVSLFDEMEKKVRNWDAIGNLRVGASITIGTQLLPELLQRFRMEAPEIRMEAVVNKSNEIEQKVLNNGVDIGLIENQVTNPDLCVVPFMKDVLCAIIPPGHPLEFEESVSLEQLAEYPFLMREKGSAGREILDGCFGMKQLKVYPVMESTRAIVSAVTRRIGVAVLPYLLVEKDIQEGRVLQLTLTEPLERNLNIVYHRSKYLTENMKKFIELCKQYGEKINCKNGLSE